MKFIVLLSLIALAFTTEPAYSATADADCGGAEVTLTFASTAAVGYVLVAECTSTATAADDDANCAYELLYVDFDGTSTYSWSVCTVVETDLTQTVSALDTGSSATDTTICTNTGSDVVCPITFDFSSTSSLYYDTDSGSTAFNALVWTEITCDSSSSAAYAMSLAASVFAF